MSKWVIDLKEMRPFLPAMARLCNEFCKEQFTMDGMYAQVSLTWRDKVCLRTGAELRTTGEGILRFYEHLVGLLRDLSKVCAKLTEYAEVDPIRLPPIEEFKVNIREDTAMSDQRIHTDTEALVRFRKALDHYIEALVRSVNDLNREYQTIGMTWKDEQYARFGEALATFKGDMQRQVQVLDQILHYIDKKINIGI